jgi:nitroreductase
MELAQAINKRKSTRSFKKKSTDWRDILEAIDSANQAPFAGNQNHLKFIIVQNKNTIKELAKHSSQTWIAESQLLIIVCSDDSHLEEHYGERGRIYGKQQAGAAIENLLLRLTDLGISSCWVGAFTDELVRNCLKIPSHIQVEAIIPTGYAQSSEPKKKKKSLEDTIYWEKWDSSRKPTIFKEKPGYPTN